MARDDVGPMNLINKVITWCQQTFAMAMLQAVTSILVHFQKSISNKAEVTVAEL